jgi:hypothetical protein
VQPSLPLANVSWRRGVPVAFPWRLLPTLPGMSVTGDVEAAELLEPLLPGVRAGAAMRSPITGVARCSSPPSASTAAARTVLLALPPSARSPAFRPLTRRPATSGY